MNLRQTDEKPNGRQIRNIVTYARALAKSENKKMTLQHLERLAEMTSIFMDSMKSLNRDSHERNELPYEEKR